MSVPNSIRAKVTQKSGGLIEVKPDTGSKLPGVADLYVVQGQEFSCPISFLDTSGVPRSLSGGTATMTIRKTHGSSTVEATYTQSSGITLANTTTNITLTAGTAATAAYTFLRGVYALEVTPAVGQDDAGTQFAVLEGVITLVKSANP